MIKILSSAINYLQQQQLSFFIDHVAKADLSLYVYSNLI